MAIEHETTVTYLEMTADPHLHTPPPTGKTALIRAERPPITFYRYLYDTIGHGYLWVDRKRLDDDALAAIIHDEAVEIYVLYRNGWPAGYFELDFRNMPEVELEYLGIVPEALGQGLGRYLLAQAISLAWLRNPERLIVQTCTLDHPKALPLYQKCGFVPYAQETKTVTVDDA
jgi:GNAT superfamily N-acetyltransferase